MPDIGDFIRGSRRSAKIAIAAPGTPGDFIRRSRRSAYKIAKCVAGLKYTRLLKRKLKVWFTGCYKMLYVTKHFSPGTPATCDATPLGGNALSTLNLHVSQQKLAST